ncbi:uncharacterized protein [Coffea arabica]|uniref:Reverse transcriptase/retrotransposon-derived protein RNase H-like domain-containing protein n=1 Tax=Coffea arabica TaxID=13443 RepID=A0ABM4VYT4_COFAR
MHVDATAGGALMGKSAEKTQQLIEEMTANNYQWTNEGGNTRRVPGMLEIDTLNMLSAKMDNVVKMLNRQIPSYAKFLKEIITKKRKLEDIETIALTEEYMKEDVNVPIILGRPFLATAGTIIDVKHGLQEEKVEEMTKYLQTQVSYKRSNAYEELGLSKGLPPPSCEQVPWLELKQLPKHFKYAFLREKETLPVIVNAAFDEEQFGKFLRVLRKHLNAIGWTILISKESVQLFRCEDTNLVFNWKKCHLMVCKDIVLDHKISSKSIEIDQGKLEVIKRMPPPTNVKGIRNFHGHVGFYWRFIKDFSKIAKPLYELLAKDVPFHFNDDCLLAFNRLKMELVSAPIITSPDWNLPFELMCDASDFALGTVLGQKHDKQLHVIYYASKMLNETQINYATTEELLAESDLEIKDKKGFENLVADHLFKLENMPQEDHIPIKEEFLDEFLLAIQKSPWFEVSKAIISDEGGYQSLNVYLGGALGER